MDINLPYEDIGALRDGAYFLLQIELEASPRNESVNKVKLCSDMFGQTHLSYGWHRCFKMISFAFLGLCAN